MDRTAGSQLHRREWRGSAHGVFKSPSPPIHFSSPKLTGGYGLFPLMLVSALSYFVLFTSSRIPSLPELFSRLVGAHHERDLSILEMNLRGLIEDQFRQVSRNILGEFVKTIAKSNRNVFLGRG